MRAYNYSQIPYIHFVVPFRPKCHFGGPENLGLDPFREVLVKPARCNPLVR